MKFERWASSRGWRRHLVATCSHAAGLVPSVSMGSQDCTSGSHQGLTDYGDPGPGARASDPILFLGASQTPRGWYAEQGLGRSQDPGLLAKPLGIQLTKLVWSWFPSGWHNVWEQGLPGVYLPMECIFLAHSFPSFNHSELRLCVRHWAGCWEYSGDQTPLCCIPSRPALPPACPGAPLGPRI